MGGDSLAAAGPLQVRQLRRSDATAVARWDAFVLACPGATFFHRAGWQTIVEEVYRHPTYFLYAERDGVIEGVLPLAQVKSWLFGSWLASLPFAMYGGVAASTDEAAQVLEQEAQAVAGRLSVDYLEMRNLELRHADWPAQDLYVRFCKEMAASVEENMLAIPRKQRAMVRKGIKNGLRSELDDDAGRFFRLYADNVHRHGTPAFPRRYFETLQQVFGPDCQVLTVVDQSGRALSSVISFYFRDQVLPYSAGDEVAARELAANDFKYWELMRRSCESGLRVFDFGRSKRDTGSYAFKKNWGFVPQPLSYEYRLYRRDAVPQNNPSNAKYRFLIQTWRRLPIGLANWLGPFLVRSLG